MQIKKNILIITNLFPNSHENTRGIFIKQLVDQLLEFYNIEVIAPVPWFPKFFSFFCSNYKNLPYQEEIDGILVYHPRYFVIPKTCRSLYGFFYFFSLFPLLKKLCKIKKIDLISAHWIYPDGFAAVLCAKFLNIKISLHALGCDINQFTKYYFRRKMIGFALSNSDVNIVKNTELKKKIISLRVPAEKNKLIMNGVNRKEFKPLNMAECRNKLNWPQNKRIILFVGNFQEEKGLKYLIQAYYMIRQEMDNVLLFIIGGGRLEQRIKKLVTDLDVDDGVKFCGMIKHTDISIYLNSCDILCVPSLREGCPNIVIEALSCGKPVVASKVGGVPEIITSVDFGIMVNPADSQDLCRGLKEALAREWHDVHKFQWRSWHDNALRIFKEFRTII
ncbi:teichuronic acid biosynthesis glycosyltransferase TuaC [Candidatus Magnetomoraceae bacterium gMMP-15]